MGLAEVTQGLLEVGEDVVVEVLLAWRVGLVAVRLLHAAVGKKTTDSLRTIITKI